MKENGFDKYFEYLNSMFSSRVTEEDKFWEVCSTLSFVMVGCLLPPNGLTVTIQQFKSNFTQAFLLSCNNYPK